MPDRLLYVMDPMCSWCWGFAPVLDALMEQAAGHGIALRIVVGGLRRERVAQDAAGRARTLTYWHAVAEASGQPFALEQGPPLGLVYDTESACRALVTARLLDEAAVWPLAKRIQHAFYVEAHDVTQASILVELAEAVGLPRIEFAPLFDAASTQAATQADFAWALNLGIAGFPTLLAERAGQLALITNGYQPLARLGPLLETWLTQGGEAR